MNRYEREVDKMDDKKLKEVVVVATEAAHACMEVIFDALNWTAETHRHAHHLIKRRIEAEFLAALTAVKDKQKQEDDMILTDMCQDSRAFRMGVIAGAAADRLWFVSCLEGPPDEDETAAQKAMRLRIYRQISKNIGALDPDSVTNPFVKEDEPDNKGVSVVKLDG